MKTAVHRRALLVCLVLVAGFSVLSARLVHLQWFDRDDAVREAEASRTEKEVVPARFGLLVDRKEEIIARNLPVTTIVADTTHLRTLSIASLGVAYANSKRTEEWITASEKERKKLVRRERRRLQELYSADESAIADLYLDHVVEILAPILRTSRRELKELIGDPKRVDIQIAKDLREDLADEIERKLKDNYIEGFKFVKSMRRWYAASKLATHTIGFVNHQGIGQCGLEATMSKYLAGKPGYRIFKRDNRGQRISVGGEKLVPPRMGLNVQTTLDLSIQAIAEEELDWGLEEFESRRGAVIMMEPKTGDILAIASRPHFDLNLREGIQDSSFHYAIQGLYEPGSTLKIVAVGGALDAGLLSLKTPIECGWGKVHVTRGTYVYDHHPYGTLSVSDVLMKSSNTGAYRIAKKLGRVRFVDYLQRFGFTEPTGIDLYGEAKPLLADATNAIDFSRMAYGYSVAVTPLQVANSYVAVANGGMLMRPRLVQAVIANDGTVVERFEPQKIGRVMRESSAKSLRTALATVISAKGTARLAAVPGFRAGGKTGTADKLKPSGRGFYKDRNVVSFAGMLPAHDPAFVCVVVIDDPQTTKVKRYGGTIAAPIFSRIATRTAAYLNLTPTEPIEEDAAVAAANGNQ